MNMPLFAGIRHTPFGFLLYVFYYIPSLILGIWGMVLIFLAYKRGAAFWPLIVATLLAIGPPAYLWGHFYQLLYV